MSGIEWKQLTIGHLSRNKYWGESDSQAYHPVLATTTVIRDGDTVILADPSQPFEEMKAKLKQYCGLEPGDVDIVFATHYHGDHRVDMGMYENAVCYMSQASIRDMESAREKAAGDDSLASLVEGEIDRFRPAPGQLTEGVRLYPLPGHTPGLTGLIFKSRGRSVLVAGDTIMGPEYFENLDGYWFNEDLDETRRSIRKAARDADIIIPGHGDAFVVSEHRPGMKEMHLSWRRLNLPGSQGCTCLIQDGGKNMVINPLGDAEGLEELLYNRSGLKGKDVGAVIFTDGAKYDSGIVRIFPQAELLLPEQLDERLLMGLKEAFYRLDPDGTLFI